MAFPLEGLAAYWTLDELSGLRRDRVGGAHLTPYNGVSAGAGIIRRGAHLQQVNGQYLGSGDMAPIDTGNIDFTLTAWIKPASPGQMVVIGKDALTGRDYLLEVSETQTARFSVSRNSGAAVVESAVPIPVGAWSFLVALHDAAAKTIGIVVNSGPLVTASTNSVPPNVSASEFRIGSRALSPIAEYFDGTIDEVGLYKRKLTVPEIAALWNGGAALPYPEPPPPPPLVEALRDRLLTLATVTNLVGERIYTLQFPQSLTAPALRLQEIDRVSAMHLRGVAEIVRARVQVDAVEANHHGDPYEGAHSLAAAVRGSLVTGEPSGLAGFRGELSGIAVSGILADDQRERYDAETQMVRIEQDFVIWFAVH